MKIRIPVAVSFLTILAVAFAFGQTPSSILGQLNVPFGFSAAKKTMPPGKYEIARSGGSSSYLLLRHRDTNTTVNVSVIERLARTDDSTPTAKLVFNTVGDKKFLSEFWPSGTDDGYLLQVTKQEHKHEIVK